MSLDASQVGDFLKANPDFLKQNPGILAFVHLPAASSGNVASLQDRQIKTLRDKIKALEAKLVDLSRAAVENQALISSLQAVQRQLLMNTDDSKLPELIVSLVAKHFQVPMVRLSLWADESVSEEEKAAIDGMAAPLYCGFSENAPSLRVFEGEEVLPRSVVIIPLRVGANPKSFGVLGLGSSDKDRFAPNLETDFLETLAETLCAALSRLQKAKA